MRLGGISHPIVQAPDLAVTIVVSYRPEFQAAWVGQPHTTLIVLTRLDKSQSAALASNVGGGHELSRELTEQIADRTDGVPLFVEELTKTIIESGFLTLSHRGRDKVRSPPTHSRVWVNVRPPS